MTYRLSELVPPVYRGLHRELKRPEGCRIVLKGGRGSGKSTFAALEGILLLLRHPGLHGVVLRRVGTTLRNSVFAQYRWAVAALGLEAYFRATVSPMALEYLPTGQRLLFLGADDPGKLKSLRPGFGYFGFLHLEELDQFAGPREVRSIEQSLLRGGGSVYEIKSFNPPRSRSHWANRYCEEGRPGELVHHSSYLDLPPEWLGARFLADAAHLKAQSPAAYEHEYLGVANAAGGLVFDNLLARTLDGGELARFDRVYAGVDWGWYPDPWAFNLVYYRAAARELYILDEARAHKRSNEQTARTVLRRAKGLTVVCDAAEPKSISDYRAAGIRAQAAQKGAGSVEYSYKWLQGLAAIVIDPARCPHSYREFRGCEYARGRDGEVLGEIPDRDNHHIDAVRYATERIWRRRGR